MASLALCGCVTAEAPVRESSSLEDAAVQFMAMRPIEEAVKGARSVVRLYSVDDTYWPVVEFVEPLEGPVRVSATNVPGNFGARRMSANVDAENWKLLQEDLALLRSAPGPGGTQTVRVDLASTNGGGFDAGMVCTPKSWIVVADEKGVTSPGMPAWNSCANRQGAALPGFFGLALYSLAPCGALEPQDLNAEAVARCLRILGRRDVALELSNAVEDERLLRQAEGDDLDLIRAHFGPETQFQIRGEAAGTGLAAFTAGWASLAPGHDMRIGLSTFQGLSDREVEVRGEASYVIDRDLSGRELAAADRQLWFAPFHQVWVKGPEGWTIAQFVIDRPMQAFSADPIQRYLDSLAFSSSAPR